MRPSRTFVIEQDGLLREGLRKILSRSRFQPLRVCNNLDEFDELRKGSQDPLVILGTRDLVEASQHVAQIRERSSTARIAVLLEDCDLELSLPKLVLAGANAVLARSVNCALLLKSLDLVLFDKSVVVCSGGLFRETVGSENFQMRPTTAPQPASTEQAQADIVGSFSNRELAILSCLEFGGSNKVIGRKLGITEATVKVHLKAIMRKLRVKNRTQAALWRMRQSPTAPEPVFGQSSGFGRSDTAHIISKNGPHAAY
jgi:two-component system, NarL family, nitrate/nitrite response regulator NarL